MGGYQRKRREVEVEVEAEEAVGRRGYDTASVTPGNLD